MPSTETLDRWEAAASRISWRQPWHTLYDPDEHGGRWFIGATLNAAENCVDRHLPQLAEKVALYWEGEPGDRRALTYRDLHREVCAFADALRALGVGAGDRVALHMGLLPETVVAMLACARLGAVHALLAAALPADALADRLADFEPKVLVTQDGAWRHGVMLPLKARADEAIPAASGVEHTVVVRRTGIDVAWYEGDRWYDELLARPRPGTATAPEPPQPMPADHPLLVVYIANRRGHPTGIVYGTGGFLAYAATMHADGLTSSSDDVLWCPVEIAWVVGQSHGVYGVLACGGTSVLYEGMLDTPTHGRSWDIIERHRVNTFVTTPSVVRNLRRWVDSPPRAGQLDSLRLAITGGEALAPDLYRWLRSKIAPSVADGWGQTELGGLVVLSDTPSGAGLPPAGLDVVDESGRSLGAGVEGEVVLREPWPATFIGVHNDHLDPADDPRGNGTYRTGDRAVLQPDGSFGFLGRIDPVVTVSGQLVSLTEVREALLEHPFVREAEVVDHLDRQTGQSLAACVVFADSLEGTEELAHALRSHVRERLGGLAQPQTIAFVDSFPGELDNATLRKALAMLCAAARDDVYISISSDELRAAAGSAGGPTAS
jgi:acetyl-CoA synthetase